MFISCQPEKKEAADIYSGIPASSAIVIETRDIHNTLTELSQTKIYIDADSLPPVLALKNEILSLKGLFASDTLTKFLRNRKVVISTSLSGAGKYDMLFLIPADREFDRIAGRELAKQYKYRKKTYAGAEVYTFYSGDKEKFSLSSYRDVLLLSKSINLVEEAIRQLNSDYNLMNNPAFEKLYRTANKKDLANIFINLPELPGWLKKILPLAETHFLTKAGEWAELDLQIYNQEVIMSGIVLIPEKGAFFTRAFKGISEQKTGAQNIIPASVGLWVSYTFENAEEYHRNYLEFLKSSGNLNRYEQQLDALGFDPGPALLSWVDTEMGLIYTEASAQNSSRTAYFKYRSQSKAEELLATISDSTYIDGYRGYILKKLRFENLLPAFHGRLFKEFSQPYYIIAEDFVLFSEDDAALKGIINDLLAGKVLASDESFQEFEAKLPSQSHIKVVGSNPAFSDLLASVLEGADVQTLEKSRKSLNNYRWAALQLNVDANAAFVNFYLVNEARAREEVIRQWSTALESSAQRAPQLVLNHTNKKYDVLVQDRDNRLYLIDADGNILWKKQLDGPLMGNVTQVDAFKNNKLQMVFNTQNKLYMVDRLGRDVENFPVKLSGAATAPVGVFNYDRARNYRFVVPAGNNLLNFSIEGRPVKGWAFKKADSELISMPQLFTINKKDAIVVLSAKGTLYLLNRKGEPRFKSVPGLQDVTPPFYLREDDKLRESELLAAGEEGKMYVIGFNGAVDQVYLDSENPAHHFLYFDNKYIFTHDDKLFVKSDENPWSTETEADISEKPKAMIFRREFYLAAYSNDAEKIFLYNKTGDLVKGFPVFAQGSFDMGSLKQDGAINIVAPTGDGTLICYRVR